MQANETRVSQAFRSVESGADSHEELNPPDAAGQAAVLLDEAERSAFWTGILAHQGAARRMALRFVAPQDVDDVVDTAMVRCIESLPLSKKRKLVLTNDDAFRRWFLKAVRNHAINCAHIEGSEPSVHFNWGVEMEPAVGGRRAGDRSLDHVFARNDHGFYDAPAPIERRPQDDIEKLGDILREHMDDLPPMQREVMHQTLEGRKREDVAEALGIKPKTYDCHKQAAFNFLRMSLPQDALAYPELDHSVWYDIFEELRERGEARSRRRASEKKGEHSTLEGEPSRSGGDHSKSEGEGDKSSAHLLHRQYHLPAHESPVSTRKATAAKSRATITNRQATQTERKAPRTKRKATGTRLKVTRA